MKRMSHAIAGSVTTLLASTLLAGAGCADPTDDTSDDVVAADGKEDSIASATDVVSTKLGLDFKNKLGKATLTFAKRGSVSLEAAGLTITSVRDANGPKTYRMRSGRLQASAARIKDSLPALPRCMPT